MGLNQNDQPQSIESRALQPSTTGGEDATVASSPTPAPGAASLHTPANYHEAGFSADSFHQYEQRMIESGKSQITQTSEEVHSQSSNENLKAKQDANPGSNSSTTLNSGEKPHLPLPEKRQARPVRMFRHTLWNVYRRLFSIVFAANAIAVICVFATSRNPSGYDIWNLATASSVNIFIGTGLRQDYVQHILYGAAWLVPPTAPLRLRRIVAKVYENGGVHSSTGVAATMWFVALTVLVAIQYANGQLTSRAVVALTCILQALLITILVFAYPALRSVYHNTFEMTHRFAGWLVMILFWIELGLIADATAAKEHVSVGHVLVRQPSFWFLIFTTIHTILPWLNLRRWEFDSENLSNHAVRLHFKKTLPPFTGVALSTNPLFEWHAFAALPSLIEEPTGGSIIVSSAGDWTKECVTNTRKYYWVKGWPKPGVLSMTVIFKRVVVVTTGSGIGPCLAILASGVKRVQCRVLWSGPNPEATFGSEITNCVRRVDPLAVIINTRTQGRPDMVALTYQLYIESGAEAVFVISNPFLTRKIVYGMESRGVPAFGPVWDS
jgi:hypothetical protein